MGVLKEFVCIVHGEFESSHPICPNYGCDSKGVSQEFRTPVRIGTQFRKAFDAGIRKSSEMMGGKNFRTAKAGIPPTVGRRRKRPVPRFCGAISAKGLWGARLQN